MQRAGVTNTRWFVNRCGTKRQLSTPSEPTVESIEALVKDGKHKEAMLDAWQVSYKLWNEGMVDECLPLAEIVLRCSREMHGDADHMDTAEALNNKGIILARMSNMKESEEALEAALAMKRKLVGDADKVVAETLRNLGNICVQTGRFDEADTRYAESIKILREDGDKNLLKHSLQAIVWGYNQAQKPDRAAKYSEILTELQPKLPNGGTIEDFWGLFEEGGKRVQEGSFQQGLDCFENALHVLTALQPQPENQYALIAKCLINSGSALFNMGNLDGAELFINEGLQRQEAVEGVDEEDRMVALNTLGNINTHRGKHDDALKIFEDVLEMHTKLMGKDHTDRAVYLMNLGLVHLKLGNQDKGMALLQEAADAHTRHGIEDVLTAKIYRNLGSGQFAGGRMSEAVQTQETALELFKKVAGPEHPETALAWSALGHVRLSLSEHAVAMDCFKQGLAIARKVFGEQHGQVVWSLDKIAHCLHALGQVDEALASFHQALDAQMLIAKDLTAANLCRSIAAIEWNRSGWEAAAVKFEEQREILTELFGDKDERVKEANEAAELARAAAKKVAE